MKDITWPVGASSAFAGSIAKRYKDLGGKIYYRQRVTKILTKNVKAYGVKLADGGEERAEIIISNADGQKTLLDLLEGRYLDPALKHTAPTPRMKPTGRSTFSWGWPAIFPRSHPVYNGPRISDSKTGGF